MGDTQQKKLTKVCSKELIAYANKKVMSPVHFRSFRCYRSLSSYNLPFHQTSLVC